MFPLIPFMGAASSHNRRATDSIHVARANLPTSGKPRSLPFEGTLYDDISISNFIDMDQYNLTASLTKSVPINALSTMLDADLPAMVAVSGKLGNLCVDGLQVRPLARVSFNVRLLDLGASDSRQKGYLRFKASARTDGRCDHGFEIDRKVELFSLPDTTLYGNVSYKTTNNADAEWKTNSSFGIHQDFRVAGIKVGARLGFTPEGHFVYDLKL